MGRKKKIGLTWFRMDVDIFQDIKVRKLIRRQGGKAFTVYALLLGDIYRNGYYMRWDTELPFIISEQTGYDEVYIQEVIKSCLSLGLFSEKLFNTEGILTSRGIQTRYLDALNYMKRKAEIEEYSLLSDEDYDENSVQKTSENMPISPKKSEDTGISSEEKAISSEEMAISSEESTQREKREKKEKTKKEITKKKTKSELTLPYTSQEFIDTWEMLCQQPKWRKKTESALQMSLKKLGKYPEMFAIHLMEDAIAGGYQGIVFDNTDIKFQQWQKNASPPPGPASQPKKAMEPLQNPEEAEAEVMRIIQERKSRKDNGL